MYQLLILTSIYLHTVVLGLPTYTSPCSPTNAVTFCTPWLSPQTIHASAHNTREDHAPTRDCGPWTIAITRGDHPVHEEPTPTPDTFVAYFAREELAPVSDLFGGYLHSP
ncbi:uncharacterized protein B0H18DRAFT_1025351 [Fomitopsis serialis]|uniref:uncharacterized protein n=1 Tax=Fomitopsis serialis TaxID=139415 RepID=UPI002008B11C|nr:uncharacterized protein B0H18DRAFT_1025351 [Neoantrodia serialis]KAH9920149.1 hypothetical protein B0H18DRAFT_1025351 [Neoantrodia serialis]